MCLTHSLLQVKQQLYDSDSYDKNFNFDEIFLLNVRSVISSDSRNIAKGAKRN